MSDAVARPPDGFTGFSIRHRYRRMEMEEPDYEGMWADVRTNLTHGERRDFFIVDDQIEREWRDDIRLNSEKAAKIDEAVTAAKNDKERAAAVKKRDEFLVDQADAALDLRRKKFALVAPYVKAWNVYDDQFQAVPPPAIDAETAFQWIDDGITAWLITSCEEAYRGGPKGKNSSKPSADAPEPLPEPTTESGKD